MGFPGTVRALLLRTMERSAAGGFTNERVGMETIIYYFSGTGNSLQVAKRLASSLDARLVAMAGALDGELAPARRVGLVFPIYMYRPPKLVARFMERLRPADYTFVVMTYGGDLGGAVERTGRHLGQAGVSLDAAFAVKMPDNYTPFGGPGPEDEQRNRIERADVDADEIAKAVEAGARPVIKRKSLFRDYVHPGIFYAFGYHMIPRTDARFVVKDSCNGCGSCAQVCPVGNIEMVEDRPRWKGKCEQCLACLQWCAPEAIELGKATEGVTRYRNPTVKRREMIL